jgi:hypothetical protein
MTEDEKPASDRLIDTCGTIGKYISAFGVVFASCLPWLGIAALVWAILEPSWPRIVVALIPLLAWRSVMRMSSNRSAGVARLMRDMAKAAGQGGKVN